jgi:hypothetical protein
MQDINKFIKGMNSDVHPSIQPPNTSREVYNFVPLTEDGNLYSMVNESGTSLFNVTLPDGFKIIGQCVLNTDIILVLVNPDTGASQIGFVRQDNNPNPQYGYYHPVAPVDVNGNVPEDNTEFGFDFDYPVDCQARKLINGDRILYFTDLKNPYGRVDLDNPPDVGNVKDNIKLTSNQKIPVIELVDVVDAVGELNAGVYHFVTRYVTKSGGVTTFGIPCHPIPVYPPSKSEGVNNIHGGFPSDGIINKNIVLEFSNIDQDFQEIEIVCIYYDGDESVRRAAVVDTLPITSDTIRYNFTGLNAQDIVPVDLAEIQQQPIAYTRAKCIEQKDNRLFLSNLKAREIDYDQLQLAANNVGVKYIIDEVLFSNRGENQKTSSIVFSNVGDAILQSNKRVEITFNNIIDAQTGKTENTDFILHKQGKVSEATITLLDSSSLQDGDTIVIEQVLNPDITLTARSIVTQPGEFTIGATNEDTATNITNTINDLNPEFSAIVDTNIVNLLWDNVSLPSNGKTITYSGSPAVIATTNFTGADPNFTGSEIASNIIVDNNIVTVEFTTFQPTGADKIEVIEAVDQDGNTFTTGAFDPTGDSTLSIVPSNESQGNDSEEETFTDYVNEKLTFNKKGYRRDEVYSLGFMLLYEDGFTSDVVHIPASADNVDITQLNAGENRFKPQGQTWDGFNTSNSTGELGTYVSTLEYPKEQSFPGLVAGDDSSTAIVNGTTAQSRLIRHHLMPPLFHEPHYRNVNGQVLIRIMGLEFNNLNIPPELLTDVAEVVFVRESRNKTGGKSIISQGVINRSVVMADDYNNDGIVQGSNILGGTDVINPRKGYFSTQVPLFDNLDQVRFTGDDRIKSSGHTKRSIVYNDLIGANTSDDPSDWTLPLFFENGKKLNSVRFNDRVFFHSPEHHLLSEFKLTTANVSGGDIEIALYSKGRFKASWVQEQWRSDDGIDYLKFYPYGDFYGDYNDYLNVVANGTHRVQTAREIIANQLRSGSIGTTEVIRTGTRWMPSSFEMQLETNTGTSAGTRWSVNLSPRATNCGGADFFCDDTTFKRGAIQTTSNNNLVDLNSGFSEFKTDVDGEFRRHIYNIKVNIPSQYSGVDNTEYIPIARFKLGDNYTDVFDGDTFITRWSYNDASLVYWTGYDRSAGASINKPKRSNTQRPTGYVNGDGINLLDPNNQVDEPGIGFPWGIDLRWCTSLFVESDINTYFRHKPPFKEDGVTPNDDPQDYFPNESNISNLLENYNGWADNIRAYNGQYSFENKARTYFSRGSLNSAITEFENRTIYSEQAANDDLLDSYRSFLVNDFYDLPSNTGPIWDSFVEYNMLFLHTTKSLWKTFAEPAATLAGGNISDVVLGTGSLFQRPSVEMLSADGGYGGTISQFGGTNTQMGYIFPDVLQGKIFGLTTSGGGPFLKELSQEGLSTFFHKNLPENLIRNNGVYDEGLINTDGAHLIDNPYKGIGLNGGYDYKLKRYWIVNHSNPFTVSYSLVTQSWISYHDYRPNCIIPYNNQVLFIKNDEDRKMYEMNTGNKGDYFGQVYDSYIEYICVADPKVVKVFDNIAISSESMDGLLKIKDDNFKTIQVTTDRQNTGAYNIISGNTFSPTKNFNEIFVKFRNDEYRLMIPRDAVIDNGGDIYDPANINQQATFRERIKGDYAIIKFTYDNIPNYTFIVNMITTLFKMNIR